MSDISKRPATGPTAGQDSAALPSVRRFERRLPHSPEKVWRALTDESELAEWFPAAMKGDRVKGADLRFDFPDASEPSLAGEIEECDPPRLLVYTMGDETLRWELSPLPDGGCLLVLTTAIGLAGSPANENGGAISARLAA